MSQGVRWTALQTFGTQALQFVVFAILARLLTPTEFGVIGIAAIFVSLSEVFAGWAGLSAGLIQRETLVERDLNSAFWLSVLITSVFAFVLVAAAGPIASLFSEPDVVPVVRVMALIPLIGALAVVPSALLSRALRFKALSIRSLSGVVGGGLVGVVMAFAGYGVWAIVGQQVASRVVSTVAVFWATAWRPRLEISWESNRWLVPFSLSIIGRDIVAVISRRADNLIIGVYLETAALGVYRVGYRAFLVATEVLLRTTSRLALPTLSRLKKNPENLRLAYYTAIRLTAFLGIPAFLGIAVLSEEVVLAFFGNQWDGAGAVLAALAVSGVVQSVTFFDSSMLVAVGRPGSVVRISVINTVLNVVGFLIAIRWGIAAVAAAYSIRTLATAPLWLFTTAKHVGTRPSTVIRQILGPTLLGLTMVAVIIATRTLWLDGVGPIPTLGICVTLGLILYGSASWLTQRSTLEEAWALIRAGRREN